MTTHVGVFACGDSSWNSPLADREGSWDSRLSWVASAWSNNSIFRLAGFGLTDRPNGKQQTMSRSRKPGSRRGGKNRKPAQQIPFEHGSEPPGVTETGPRQLVSDMHCEPDAAPVRAPRWLWVLIILVGVAAFWTCFQGVFVFDDVDFVDDPSIRRLSDIGEVLRATRRPVANLTLAVNYAIGGFAPLGYHVVNLVIHLLAGLTLFGVIRRTLRLDRFAGRYDHGAEWLALTVALLWVIHPLQTQTVTYTIQRAESLMGLFYLLTMYCVLRGARLRSGLIWYFGAVAACALGAGSKAVMVTAPVVVVLFDWVFIAPSWKALIRKRWGLYAGLAVAMVIVLWSCRVLSGVLATGKANATVGFSVQSVSPLEYALTQAGVIVHYLKLSFWPANLCLDYQWELARGAGEIVPYVTIIVVLLIWTGWGLARKSGFGFAGAWFFLILAPTSSIVPIKDLAFEHRMYLPLAGVVVFVVFGISELMQRVFSGTNTSAAGHRFLAAALVVASAAPLAYATSQRNMDYHSRVRMWGDVLDTRPNNPRAHSEYGRAWNEEEGDLEKAIEHYTIALELQPDYPLTHFNLANALRDAGRSDDAIAEYRLALKQRSRYPQALINLGTVLMKVGRYDHAAKRFRAAGKQDPQSTKAVYNLGNALMKGGRLDDAESQFRKAVQMDPGHVKARTMLGLTMVKQGRLDDAAEAYRGAIRRNPRHVTAVANLGIVYEKQERWTEAAEQFRKTIDIDPKYVLGHYRLGKAFAGMGRHADAISSFEEALRLKPKHKQARRRLKSSRRAIAESP